MHPHLARNKSVHNISILKFYPECRVRKVFNNLPLHFNQVFLCHFLLITLEVSLLQQTFILMGHQVGLNLCHEVHCHHHNN